MIDLKEEYLEFIKKTVASQLKDFRLFIFGSRTKNCAKKYSDVDIAIDSKYLNDKIKSHLEYLFENSLLPYQVDVIDLNNITQEFKKAIQADLVEI